MNRRPRRWNQRCFDLLSADRRGDFHTVMAQVEALLWRDGTMDELEMKAWARWIQSAIDRARGSLIAQ